MLVHLRLPRIGDMVPSFLVSFKALLDQLGDVAASTVSFSAALVAAQRCWLVSNARNPCSPSRS